MHLSKLKGRGDSWPLRYLLYFISLCWFIILVAFSLAETERTFVAASFECIWKGLLTQPSYACMRTQNKARREMFSRQRQALHQILRVAGHVQ